MEPPKAQPSQASRLGRDLFMVALALVSIALLIYDEVKHPAGSTRSSLILVDAIIVVIFTIEFLARLWRADSKKEFLKRNWYEIPGLVPMVAGEVSFLRVFRLARLARVFRLFRAVAVLSRLRRANRVAENFLVKSHILTTAAVTATVIVGLAFAAWLFERDHNPQFASFGNALWWAVVTGATVGYGDIVPQTTGGRVVATLLMFTGIGLIGVLAATIANALARMRAETKDEEPMATRPIEARLTDLAALHREGRLTDDEFARAKAQVLQEPS